MLKVSSMSSHTRLPQLPETSESGILNHVSFPANCLARHLIDRTNQIKGHQGCLSTLSPDTLTWRIRRLYNWLLLLWLVLRTFVGWLTKALDSPAHGFVRMKEEIKLRLFVSASRSPLLLASLLWMSVILWTYPLRHTLAFASRA